MEVIPDLPQNAVFFAYTGGRYPYALLGVVGEETNVAGQLRTGDLRVFFLGRLDMMDGCNQQRLLKERPLRTLSIFCAWSMTA